jgi:deazaflavin-dependent oxidoreductase (nitroreductase family)
MAADEEVLDSPTRWVARHVRRYVETDGRSGHKWNGRNTLLLTTRGRYVVVASNGGARNHPHWYLNLTAQPEVQVQVQAERFAAQARTAGAQERPDLWRMMAEIWPDYQRYQKRTGREIPVVILERA